MITPRTERPKPGEVLRGGRIVGEQQRKPSPGPILPGYPDCSHRWVKWGCNGERIANCSLGLGVGGIVEETDCNGCGSIQAP